MVDGLQQIKDAAIGFPVFGTVYGNGKKSRQHGQDNESYYAFEIEYENGYIVPYKQDGSPGWSGKLDFRTVFTTDEISAHILASDITPAKTILEPVDIIANRVSGTLMVRCPSGLWKLYSDDNDKTECPKHIVEDYLESGLFHLFKIKKGNDE